MIPNDDSYFTPFKYISSTHVPNIIQNPQKDQKPSQNDLQAISKNLLQLENLNRDESPQKSSKLSIEEMYNFLTSLSKEEKQKIKEILVDSAQASPKDKIIQVPQESFSFSGSPQRPTQHQLATIRPEIQYRPDVTNQYPISLYERSRETFQNNYVEMTQIRSNNNMNTSFPIGFYQSQPQFKIPENLQVFFWDFVN